MKSGKSYENGWNILFTRFIIWTIPINIDDLRVPPFPETLGNLY